MHLQQRWLVITTNREATIFSCRTVAGGGLRLESIKTIANTHEAEHEHHRPALVGGAERQGRMTNSGAHVAPAALGANRTSEEEQRRFAREISAWVKTQRRGAGDPRTTLFAPPRLLGMLREQLDRVDGSLDLRDGDFGQLRSPQLATHTTIRDAVASK